MKNLIFLLSLLILQPAFADQAPLDTLHPDYTGQTEHSTLSEQDKTNKKESVEPKNDFMSSWKFYFIVLIFPAILLLIAILFIFKRKKD